MAPVGSNLHKADESVVNVFGPQSLETLQCVVRVSWWWCSQRRLRGQRQVEVRAVEEQRPGHRHRIPLGLVQQFEQSRPDVHGDPHYDALGHSCKHTGGERAEWG